MDVQKNHRGSFFLFLAFFAAECAPAESPPAIGKPGEGHALSMQASPQS